MVFIRKLVEGMFYTPHRKNPQKKWWHGKCISHSECVLATAVVTILFQAKARGVPLRIEKY